MKKFLLVSIVAASALAAVIAARAPHAEACPPPYSPEQSRIEMSPEIVFGQVLEARALETALQDGRSVTLYQLSVHVSETLRGSTSEDALVTVYVVADTAEAPVAGASANDDVEPVATETYGLPIYGEMPQVPVPLQSYLFYARPFGTAGELVLASNEAFYLQNAETVSLDTLRQQVNSFVTYGYVY